MANIVLFSTIAIVVPLSVFCERRNSLLNSNTLHQTVPHQFNHDQKELNRNGNDLDKDPWQSGREVRVGPRSPPLPPEHPAPWSFSAYQKQLQVGKVSLNRVHELENKLTLNKIMPIQRRNKPLQNTHFNLKSPENKRIKREVDQIEDNIREKREVLINSKIMPEVIMQPRIQPALTQEAEARYQEKVIEKKRDKRQILLMIKQQPLMFGKKSRTTPNPFIPETNIADYDIVKPDTYKPEVEIVESMDTDSYQLNPIQNAFSKITKMLMNLKSWLDRRNEESILKLKNNPRAKRSPKMSKLYKKQKLAKKKRKKKKQQKLTPRQIKHYRRIREKKEKRRRILHKKLKEKRRLRHKKMGTGPYNKSIIDYYGVYFDSPTSILNDSLYDSIYDTEGVDSDLLYEEHLKNYTDSEEYSDGEEERHSIVENTEEEEYTFEGSTEEDNTNSTVDYYDPTSPRLNDSLYDSVYDTEAVDSDKIYEEHMKDYPDSEDDQESEDENRKNNGSDNISKGGDGVRNDETKKEPMKNKDINENTKNKNRDLKNIHIRTSITRLKLNTKRAEKHVNNIILKEEPISMTKQNNKGIKTIKNNKLEPNKSHLNYSQNGKLNNNNIYKNKQIKVKQKCKKHNQNCEPRFDLLDVMFDKPLYDISYGIVSNQENLNSYLHNNALSGLEQANMNPPKSYIKSNIPIMRSNSNNKMVPI